MARRVALVVAGLVLVVALIFASGGRAVGQFFAASPHADEGAATPESIAEAVANLPGEIELSLLATSELGGLNTNGLELWLERIAVSAGERVIGQALGDEILYVEAGTVSVQIGSTATTLNTGRSIGFSAGDEYGIEPSGSGGATILKISLHPKPNSGSLAASPVAVPVSELLVSGGAGRLVSRRGTLFIAKVVLPSASRTGDQSLSGPIALLVESGSIEVHDRTAPNVVIEAGQAIFLPGYTQFNAENSADIDAVVLIAGLLAPPSGAAVGPTATPIPAMTPTPTPTPTTGPDLLGTAQAEGTRLAGQIAILATREADIAKTAAALETTLTAVSQSNNANASAVADIQSAAKTAVAELQATQVSLESEIERAGDVQAGLVATVTALADELESAAATATILSEQSAAEAEAVQSEVGSLEATIVALQTAVTDGREAQSTTAALLATSESDAAAVAEGLASAEAVIESQGTAVAGAEATIESQASAISEADVLIEEQTGLLADAQATIEAQSGAISEAEVTIEEQTGLLADAQATIEAQSGAISEAEVTIEEQTGLLADAQATIEAQIGVISNAEETIESQAASLATAESESEALASDIEAAKATMTSQANAAATAEVEHEEALAAAQATAEAYAAALADASSAATAAAAAAEQTANADESEIEGLSATIAAQQTEAAESRSAAATSAVDAISAEATIIALNTALASTATVALSSLNPEFVDLSIQADLDAVLAGDETAVEDARVALDAVFAPYDGCRAGVVLTFGHGVLIGQGTVLADAINAVIQAEHPEIFGGAAFDAFGDLSPELGQVDIRIYFFTGCDAAEA